MTLAEAVKWRDEAEELVREATRAAACLAAASFVAPEQEGPAGDRYDRSLRALRSHLDRIAPGKPWSTTEDR